MIIVYKAAISEVTTIFPIQTEVFYVIKTKCLIHQILNVLNNIRF